MTRVATGVVHGEMWKSGGPQGQPGGSGGCVEMYIKNQRDLDELCVTGFVRATNGPDCV